MNSLSNKLVIVSVLLALLIQPLAAHAQEVTSPLTGGSIDARTLTSYTQGTCASAGGRWVAGQISSRSLLGYIVSVFNPSAGEQGGQCVFGNPNADPQNKGYTNPEDGIGCAVNGLNPSICLSNVVYAFTAGLGSALAYIGAYFFDTTVQLSLNSFAYALDFLSSGWTAARDIANMAFVLILVYIAFIIMFKAETTGTIQTLAWVIFIALIINFSFFFTRVVIDGGNILAVQFYNAIDAPTLDKTINTRPGALAGFGANVANTGSIQNTKDLTYSIMNGLNLQGLFGTPSFQKFYQENGFWSKFIILSVLYICAGVMYFILAAMFLAVGVKFLFRIVVLWFLIIASPLALVAKAIPVPKVKQYYDMWQDMLIKHAFYPAAFLFIFFFIVAVMNTLNGGPNNTGGLMGGLLTSINLLGQSNASTGMGYIAAAIATVAIRMGFVIAMLYIALKASEMIGVFGAGAAKAFTGWVTRAGTGAVFGGAGLAGRYTVGWAGQRVAQSTFTRDLASQPGWRGLLGSGLKRVGLGASNRTYDIRGVPGIRTGLGFLGVSTNEAAGKGGYAAAYKRRVASAIEFNEWLKPSAAQKERAFRAELAALSPAERQEVANRADEFNKAKKEVEEIGDEASKRRFKIAQTRLNENLKEINKRAKKRAGDDLTDQYANTLITPSLRNLWGVTSGFFPGVISQAHYEASAKLRDSKNTGGKILALLKETPDDPNPFSPPATPPAPGGPTPTPTPAPTPTPGGPQPGGQPGNNPDILAAGAMFLAGSRRRGGGAAPPPPGPTPPPGGPPPGPSTPPPAGPGTGGGPTSSPSQNPPSNAVGGGASFARSNYQTSGLSEPLGPSVGTPTEQEIRTAIEKYNKATRDMNEVVQEGPKHLSVTDPERRRLVQERANAREQMDTLLARYELSRTDLAPSGTVGGGIQAEPFGAYQTNINAPQGVSQQIPSSENTGPGVMVNPPLNSTGGGTNPNNIIRNVQTPDGPISRAEADSMPNSPVIPYQQPGVPSLPTPPSQSPAPGGYKFNPTKEDFDSVMRKTMRDEARKVANEVYNKKREEIEMERYAREHSETPKQSSERREMDLQRKLSSELDRQREYLGRITSGQTSQAQARGAIEGATTRIRNQEREASRRLADTLRTEIESAQGSLRNMVGKIKQTGVYPPPLTKEAEKTRREGFSKGETTPPRPGIPPEENK